MKKIFSVIALLFIVNIFIHAEESKNQDIISSQTTQKNHGLFFIFDTFIDDYYLVENYGISFLSLEKSILKNYHDISVMEKYSKDLPIFITFRAPMVDHLFNLKNLYFNIETKPNYKMTLIESELSKNSTIANKAIDGKLSQQDKIYIFNKLQILPKNFNLEQYPKYKKLISKIDYNLLNSTDTISIPNSLKNLDNNFFIKVLIYYNIFWLDDVSLATVCFNNKAISKSLDMNDDAIILTKIDLQFVMDLKKQLLEKAIDFFYSLPQNWNYIVYPYYDPKMDILASNKLSFYMNKLLLNNIDLPSDAFWQVVKSFKSFNAFFNHKMPIGIMTDLDFVDENVMKIFALRDYELIFNKGKFYNYEPVVLNRDTKNIYMLFENVDFYYDNLLGAESTDLLMKDFFKNISNFTNKNMDTIFILNSAKLAKLSAKDTAFDLDKFYLKIFTDLKKISNFVDIVKYKNGLLSNSNKNAETTSLNNSVKKINQDKKAIYKQPINIINIINLEDQDFIINTDSLVDFLNNDKNQNYWVLIKNLKQKIDDKKNKAQIDNKTYNEFINNLYRLESVDFLNNLGKDKVLDKELHDIVKSIDGNFEEKITQNIQNIQLIQPAKVVQEFSKITYFDDNKGFYLEDSLNDDYGAGNYLYPDNPLFTEGTFDLKGLKVFSAPNDIIFKIFMRSLKNPFKSINGFSLPQIDIYIDMNGRKGLGNTMLLPHRNALTKIENAWEYALSVNEKGATLYISEADGNIREIKGLNLKVDLENNSINVFVPRTILDGNIFLWQYIVLTCAYDRDKNDIIKVEKTRTKTAFSGRLDDYESNIVDIILPNNITQSDCLRAKNSITEIPAVSVNKGA
jgi:hypothetical protein